MIMLDVFVAVLAALLVWSAIRLAVPALLRVAFGAFVERDSRRTLERQHVWSGTHSRAWRVAHRLGIKT